MDNTWVKLADYDNLFEAQMRKVFLESAGIQAVVVNARDSLFLIGDIELYVKKQDKEKAENILLQFQGKTKVNSFILQKPVEYFKKILEHRNIPAELVKKEETEYVLDNYEIYVPNEYIDNVKPLLMADKIDNWINIEKCDSVLQTRFCVELLAEHNIEAMIIKRKDSEYHLEEIKIFVEENNKEVAQNILQTLPGWQFLTSYTNIQKAELIEDLLGASAIRVIIKKENEQYKLFVPKYTYQKATEILNENKKMVKIKTYDSFIKAQKDLITMKDANIYASVISKKDNMFLLGEYYLYVEDTDAEKALKILSGN